MDSRTQAGKKRSGRLPVGRSPLARIAALLLVASLSACAPLAPHRASAPAPIAADVGNGAIPGINAARLTPEHWIARLQDPASIVLDPTAIATRNARLLAQDGSVIDLSKVPDPAAPETVRALIESTSAAPQRTLFDATGAALTATQIEDLRDALALNTISAPVPLRFGLVTRRSDLRSFPTRLRVFSEVGNTDIDRFQESALFPGTPVAVLHTSHDGQWSFVTSKLYSAWIEADHVALGERGAVFDYASRSPYLIVTGAQVRTVFTPDPAQLSGLTLDMGVRLPLLADWPQSRLVNGQLPYVSHVVALPMRGPDGTLEIVPALVPRSADVGIGYLPLTRANLIRQAFKFLGERYGWGHSYGARDCSGFVSEVYRSFGVEMPRNTRDQGVSPAFDRIAFTAADDHEQRVAVLRTLDVGDLIYIPGHVMMVIGHEDGETWLIHDTTGMHYLDADGKLVAVSLNQVSVTPLFGLRGGSGTPYVDFIYSIQRIRTVDSK